MQALSPQTITGSHENLFRLQRNSEQYRQWLEQNRARIAVAAYYKAEARGFEPGQEAEDWLEAEAEIAEVFMPHEFFVQR